MANRHQLAVVIESSTGPHRPPCQWQRPMNLKRGGPDSADDFEYSVVRTVLRWSIGRSQMYTVFAHNVPM